MVAEAVRRTKAALSIYLDTRECRTWHNGLVMEDAMVCVAAARAPPPCQGIDYLPTHRTRCRCGGAAEPAGAARGGQRCGGGW